MAVATSKSQGIVNCSTGSFTGAGAIVPVILGFNPRYVQLINVTDQITQLWVEGMAANTTINTTALGAMTANTAGLIVPKGTAAADTYKGFAAAAGAAIAAKLYVWAAWG